MSSKSAMQIEFGKSTIEKLSYLIITCLFTFFSAMFFKVFLGLTGTVSPVDLMDYDLFYSVVGAALGFLFAQIFIRTHLKAVRMGRI